MKKCDEKDGVERDDYLVEVLDPDMLDAASKELRGLVVQACERAAEGEPGAEAAATMTLTLKITASDARRIRIEMATSAKHAPRKIHSTPRYADMDGSLRETPPAQLGLPGVSSVAGVPVPEELRGAKTWGGN